MLTIDDFGARARALLQAEPGAAGRDRLRGLLEAALRDEAFVAAYASDGEQSPRRLLYEDPVLRFCVLVHAAGGAGGRPVPPHDHGPSWAIYGQASGVTEMTDFEVIDPPAADRAGQVVPARTYRLEPGHAHVYNEGDVHAPRRDGPTRLIRIEGQNLEGVARPRYQLAVAATVSGSR